MYHAYLISHQITKFKIMKSIVLFLLFSTYLVVSCKGDIPRSQTPNNNLPANDSALLDIPNTSLDSLNISRPSDTIPPHVDSIKKK
ncbi:hypothetical protein D1632_07555 [Chryseobacterium nematophagum]|uniref:Uncharacterized protein n=1 Tax=Chryseobacterium nematophagum TaxID=2305228 RepID=A0A3M7LBP1_9FLAO|nr:hypothetical protein D1632_07555 [Chryseobacterium nematophagum]